MLIGSGEELLVWQLLQLKPAESWQTSEYSRNRAKEIERTLGMFVL